MASLVDTNILVYLFDPRDPVKQQVAGNLLRGSFSDDALLLPHQAIIEFISAVTRPRRDLGGGPLLSRADALLEAENLMSQFLMLYPNAEVLRTAIRGVSMYQLSWFDAHLWAYAEVFGIGEILSEDFEHGCRYGRVRTVDPFLVAADSVHELPPLYASVSSTPDAAGRTPDGR